MLSETIMRDDCRFIFKLLTTILLMVCVMKPLLAVELTADEMRLYELIMQYRKEHNLHRIPISPSLTYVAQTHAKDVYEHWSEIPSGCNSHSWSKYGAWQKCDYYPDHRNMACMHSKPRELTSYQGKGYEICHFYAPPTSGVCTPEGALKGWQGSPGHNSVIINLGKWADNYWKAIGVGMYKGVACVWFGEEIDPASSNSSVSNYNSPMQPGSLITDHRPTNNQYYTVKTTDDDIVTSRTMSKQGKDTYSSKNARKNNETWLSRYYNYSGTNSLSYFSVGYTYSFLDKRHLINISLLDFRIHMFGMSPLCAEMSVSPLDKRVAYKPAIRLHIPVAKCVALTPYVGASLDMSGIGKYIVKNYDYDFQRDFYMSCIGGVSAYVTIAKRVPFEVKAEYRHPVYTPLSGAFLPQGIYLSAQVYFGSTFD